MRAEPSPRPPSEPEPRRRISSQKRDAGLRYWVAGLVVCGAALASAAMFALHDDLPPRSTGAPSEAALPLPLPSAAPLAVESTKRVPAPAPELLPGAPKHLAAPKRLRRGQRRPTADVVAAEEALLEPDEAPAPDDGADDPRSADPVAAPVAPSDGLTRADILSGVAPVRALMERCNEQKPGQGTVKMSISSSGRVTSAIVSGMFAGSRAGECIVSAAHAAQFRSTGREQTTLVYPFVLRRSAR